jgi:NitT/TauT family transport system substrate-binding protein
MARYGRATVAFMMIIVTVVLVAACGGGGQEAGDSGAQTITITQSTTGFLYTPIYVAQANGFFEEENLNVESVVVEGGANVVASVSSGDAKVGATATSSIIEAVNQGRPVKSFAAIMNQYASNVVLKESIAEQKGITEASSVEEKVQALEGLRIGITSPGSGTDTLIRYLLEEKAGLDPDRDATLVPLGGGSEMLAAFDQEAIDAFSLSSPTSDQAVVEGDGIMLLNLSEGEVPELDGISYISLVATNEAFEEDQETIRRVYRAIEKAQEFIEEDREGSKQIMREELGDVSEPVFDSAFDRNYPAYPSSPVITEESYEKNFDFTPSVPYNEVVETSMFEE